MARAKKIKEAVLQIPPKNQGIDAWIILGLDPSLSRTGYSIMQVRPNLHLGTTGTIARFDEIGSVKPDDSSDPIWVRSKAMALFLRKLLSSSMELRHYDEVRRAAAEFREPKKYGLIVSMEFPTPQNDFLVALNRILHLILFDENHLSKWFEQIFVLQTNANTLRSLMELKRTGNNKTENQAKAYEFLIREEYPELDTDACDAVLLTMMARHTASILLGFPDEVPGKFKLSLTNAEKGVKGKGRNAKIITKGLLHRPEYWYEYKRKPYVLAVKDAKKPTKKLTKISTEL